MSEQEQPSLVGRVKAAGESMVNWVRRGICRRGRQRPWYEDDEDPAGFGAMFRSMPYCCPTRAGIQGAWGYRERLVSLGKYPLGALGGTAQNALRMQREVDRYIEQRGALLDLPRVFAVCPSVRAQFEELILRNGGVPPDPILGQWEAFVIEQMQRYDQWMGDAMRPMSPGEKLAYAEGFRNVAQDEEHELRQAEGMIARSAVAFLHEEEERSILAAAEAHRELLRDGQMYEVGRQLLATKLIAAESPTDDPDDNDDDTEDLDDDQDDDQDDEWAEPEIAEDRVGELVAV